MINAQTVLYSSRKLLIKPNQKKSRDLKTEIARMSYKILHWGKTRLPAGIRSLAGLLLMVGGVFGFLPVLGFWMFPLGLAFIALDIPLTAHKIDAWMITLKARANQSDESQDNQ